MKTPRQLLDLKVREAAKAVANGQTVDAAWTVVPATDAKFGDYQCNLAMGLAKAMKANPRAVATSLVEKLDVGEMCETPEIAGPGFINLRLKPQWVGKALEAMAQDPRLGVEAAALPKQYVVDFSSPNVAKSMHVGHIRSTIIGDAIVRMLRFAGHNVVGDNHLGDWGTQFGLLIAQYKEARPERVDLEQLERLYKASQLRASQEPEWEERARQELQKLQSGDAENLQLWHQFIDASREAFERIYKRLGVEFDTWHGESFYNPWLAEVLQDLEKSGLAREDQGALLIFFEDHPRLKDKPFLIRKKDGAALYSTTDLAAIRYRTREYNPDCMVYITDGRQQLHFEQLFEAARRWGYTKAELVHAWFGSILGADGKPLKTREGEPIKLEALLDEAEERALALVREKNPDLSPEQQAEVARVVGIGAIKYADLAQNRTSDYVFSWDKMLALNGNSGAYMQYAYARTRSIFRRGGIDPESLRGEIRLEDPAEVALGRTLLRFGEALDGTLDGFKLNAMTTYLFDLATAYSSFWEACPVLQAAEPLRTSRLMLVRLVGDVIRQGLKLLGIETIPQM